MPFLQVGPHVLAVVSGGAAENTAHEIGASDRSIDGSLNTSISGRKRSWEWWGPLMTEEEIETLSEQAPDGLFASCQGELFPPDVVQPLDCFIEWIGERYARGKNGSHRRAIQLRLSEG